jgi:hypothetical protein
MKPLGDNTPSRRTMLIAAAVALIVIAVLVLMLTQPSRKQPGTSTAPGSAATSGTAGANMAGAVQDVVISQASVNAKPAPWDLSTPQKAITSYLDWTSYAYRTATSSAATATASAEQGVRVDSYIQYNLQQKRLLDQHLDSVAFRTASTTATSTLVPAREEWTYSYLSIAKVGQSIGGPYKASYETTYTVVRTKAGTWVVADVAVKALGAVK